MAKRKSKKERGLRDQRKWEQEDQQLRSIRKKERALKELFSVKGLNLPFYDLLDSYEAEFAKVCEEAKLNHPSLMGVHEVSDEIFYATYEAQWESLGYSHLEQIFFEFDKKYEDYVHQRTKKKGATLEGHAVAFLDAAGELNTVILMRASLKGAFQHKEFKYALKLAALCHEIGHVDDFEKRINFDIEGRKADIIEAEVYAHLAAFEQMARKSYRLSYNTLLASLSSSKDSRGYLGEVIRRVLERLPQHEVVDWNESLDNISAEEYNRLKPSTRQALSDR